MAQMEPAFGDYPDRFDPPQLSHSLDFGSDAMATLLRMLEESQSKLEQQMRENAELRLHMKELQMVDRAPSQFSQPQDSAASESDSSLAGQNKKLKAEVKAAYSELAELKQTIAMRDRKIAQLQSRQTAIMSNSISY